MSDRRDGASIWVRVGEGIGYGLAAIVLGPTALMERKAQREVKRAMLRFVAAREPMKLTAQKHTLRRGARLMVSGEPLGIEVTLDPSKRRVTVSASVESLPHTFGARVSRGLAELQGLRHAFPSPLAMAENIHVDSDLDEESANELLALVTKSPLPKVQLFEVSLQDARIELFTIAPHNDDEWEILESSMIAFATWAQTKWRGSYRG